MINKIYETKPNKMNKEELTKFIKEIQEQITLNMIYGTDKSWYNINNTIIPKHKDDYTGESETLEDYTGETYQNEEYRKIEKFLNKVEYLAEEEGIEYEEFENWSIIPVNIIKAGDD